jgi:hypothetical protein
VGGIVAGTSDGGRVELIPIGFGSIVSGIFAAMILRAISELLRLAIDVEENTRRAAIASEKAATLFAETLPEEYRG